MQLKIKFPVKGKYTLSLDSVAAYDPRGSRVEISPATSQIDVM